MTYYFLDDDKKPYPAPPLERISPQEMCEWAKWFDANQRVKETTIGVYWVSTVFLGIDHQFSKNETPVLWETMITKNGDFLDYQRRYMSHDDASHGHDKVVELLSNPFTIKEIDDEL